jgi:ketosteroid isomerase-like protein
MMNRPSSFRTLSLTFVVAALVAAACASPAKDAAHTDSAAISRDSAQKLAIRDTIEAMLKDFTAKMNSGDMDGVGEYYSDDTSFYWIEGGSLRYRTAKAVREGLQSLKSIPEIELTYYETKVDVLSPTIANVRTEFSQTFRTGVGKGDTYGGYLTFTVVREAKGWRLRHGHTSSRFPRPG